MPDDYQSWLDESCELARVWAAAKEADSAVARSRFFEHFALQPLLMHAEMAEAKLAQLDSGEAELDGSKNDPGPCH